MPKTTPKSIPRTSVRPAGTVVGSVVAIVFGTIFVEVNSGGLPAPWPVVVRATGLIVAGLLVVSLLVVVRAAPVAEHSPAASVVGARYWLVVALEAVALFGGLVVINGVLHRPAVAVAWVALVVGIHFFGLGRIWYLSGYHWLGAAMTVLGVAGFVTHAGGAGSAIVGLVSGVGSGVALYVAVGAALWETLHPPGNPRWLPS